MKSILTYLAVLTLSFTVFAVEVQDDPQITAPDKIALNQENSPDTHLAPHIVSSHTIPQASAEKSSEFITALSVYVLIIIVYSIYGIKATSKNVRS
ncbi:MAG: hypothetical protein Q7T96_12420 [Methylobacter sp.]|nr:hypothetical protein [Methylobacter sp.]